ncbi:MAG: small nuclear ribonucleoprotein E [archaeon]|nr:small nuclear ribonucleoprotein E [archaeon]
MSHQRGVRKLLEAPIEHLYEWKKEGLTLEVWLYEQRDIRLYGVLLGFDQFMNLVLDQVHEVSRKHKTSKKLGRLLLKGENISLMRPGTLPDFAQAPITSSSTSSTSSSTTTTSH